MSATSRMSSPALLSAVQNCAPYAKVKRLLEKGADVNEGSRFGTYPIFEIQETRFADCDQLIDLILNHPAINLEIRNRDGETPLHFHTHRSNSYIVQKLLQLGADVDALTPHGRTALDLIADSVNDTTKLYIMRTLLENGANPNHRDEDGVTPLVTIVTRSYHLSPGNEAFFAEAARILLEAGADPTVRIMNLYGPRRGKTVLEAAQAGLLYPKVNEAIVDYIRTTMAAKRKTTLDRRLEIAMRLWDPKTGAMPAVLAGEIDRMAGNQGGPYHLAPWQQRQLEYRDVAADNSGYAGSGERRSTSGYRSNRSSLASTVRRHNRLYRMTSSNSIPAPRKKTRRMRKRKSTSGYAGDYNFSQTS